MSEHLSYQNNHPESAQLSQQKALDQQKSLIQQDLQQLEQTLLSSDSKQVIIASEKELSDLLVKTPSLWERYSGNMDFTDEGALTMHPRDYYKEFITTQKPVDVTKLLDERITYIRSIRELLPIVSPHTFGGELPVQCMILSQDRCEPNKESIPALNILSHQVAPDELAISYLEIDKQPAAYNYLQGAFPILHHVMIYPQTLFFREGKIIATHA